METCLQKDVINIAPSNEHCTVETALNHVNISINSAFYVALVSATPRGSSHLVGLIYIRAQSAKNSPRGGLVQGWESVFLDNATYIILLIYNGIFH